MNRKKSKATTEQLESEVKQLQHDLDAVVVGIKNIVDHYSAGIHKSNPVAYYALHFWINWGQRSVEGSRTRV